MFAVLKCNPKGYEVHNSWWSRNSVILGELTRL